MSQITEPTERPLPKADPRRAGGAAGRENRPRNEGVVDQPRSHRRRVRRRPTGAAERRAPTPWCTSEKAEASAKKDSLKL